MNSTIQKQSTMVKWIALLSLVRWYNIALTILAQYLGAYVLMRNTPMQWWNDFKLHAIVLASVFSIAAGFIINNFYDFEKDMINKPEPTMFNRAVSKATSLNLYIVCNLLALIIGYLASIKIGLFFTVFIALLWVYSHKLQRLSFIKELAAALLSVTCFFAVLLHYNRFYPYVFVYGAFYMSLVYIRELVKQFMSYNGDLALNIQSLPVSLGIDKAKSFLNFIMVLSVLGGSSILLYYGPEQRQYFIALGLITEALLFVLISQKHYKVSNRLLKVLLVLGIANLLWM